MIWLRSPNVPSPAEEGNMGVHDVLARSSETDGSDVEELIPLEANNPASMVQSVPSGTRVDTRNGAAFDEDAIMFDTEDAYDSDYDPLGLGLNMT